MSGNETKFDATFVTSRRTLLVAGTAFAVTLFGGSNV